MEKRDFLSVEELHTLTKLYFSNRLKDSMQHEVLRYFLFACYTGLRYSDIKNLTASSFKHNQLQITMHKTNHIVNIPLSKKALSILPTLSINPSSEPIFRVYCNKVTNRLLKEIARKAKITKKLTFHVSRHTFATVSIHLGIPIEVISKLLGHTNLKTTQVYAKIVDQVKEREMEKWNSL